MPKKIFILLIVLVIILGGALIFQKQQSSLSQRQSVTPIAEDEQSAAIGSAIPSPASGKEHVIELTEDGFQPEKVEIKKGETVKFVSRNKSYYWPASDLHPTHTIYSGFDPKEPIASSSSWSFRFEKIGKWKYHDHLAPYFTGEVEVIE